MYDLDLDFGHLADAFVTRKKLQHVTINKERMEITETIFKPSSCGNILFFVLKSFYSPDFFCMSVGVKKMCVEETFFRFN